MLLPPGLEGGLEFMTLVPFLIRQFPVSCGVLAQAILELVEDRFGAWMSQPGSISCHQLPKDSRVIYYKVWTGQILAIRHSLPRARKKSLAITQNK